MHVDAMLDSFSKTMSRSGLMSPFNGANKSGNVSTSGGSSTLSRSSLGSNMSNKMFSARVVFLDDTCQTFDVDKRAKGQYLLDTVFHHLELGERDFFGIMFNDTGADSVPNGHAPDLMRWLDPEKLIRKQVRASGQQKVRAAPVVTLYFRVKFYVTGNCTLLHYDSLIPRKTHFCPRGPKEY
jgi:tyrosine-protein phosphatase non-receptor type 4